MAVQGYQIAVVTPVFEDREASNRLFAELGSLFGDKVTVVAVDDGSVREPVQAQSLSRAGVDGVVLRLKRNVGHQRAIAIGLSYVADQLPGVERIVVMDSDGEDNPATVAALLRALESPDFDVAVAQRKSRVETFRFRAFYWIYKIIFGALTGRKISFGNFMALKPSALHRLTVMQELWVHVAGSVLASRLRVAACPLDRGARYAGRSQMNFVGLALHGFKGLMVFAEDVLVRVGIMCVFISILAILGAAAAIALKLMGFATPGWFSVALGVLFLVFLQTATLTLMTLMLSGVAKGGALLLHQYRDFVDAIIPAHAADSA